MTNGHFDFELEGVSYSLHFGNIAVEEFSKKSLENLQNGITGETKSLTDMVYAGLLNNALIKGTNLPKYGEIVELTDQILDSDMLQEDIIKTFMESRATVKQIERLNPKSEKKKKVETIGTQQKATPTDTSD